jgi:hypothetical protein
VIAALAFGAVNVSEAVAASPGGGVHVDPNSPAGKQYVIPIVGARSQTSGGNSSSGASPPAFGVGITPDLHKAPGSATSTGSPAGRAHEKGGASSRKQRQSLTVSGAAGAGGVPPSGPSSSSGGSAGGGSGNSDWLPLGAGGALVLLVGGGGGLALRRRI